MATVAHFTRKFRISFVTGYILFFSVGLHMIGSKVLVGFQVGKNWWEPQFPPAHLEIRQKNMLIDMLAIPRNGSASGIPDKKGLP